MYAQLPKQDAVFLGSPMVVRIPIRLDDAQGISGQFASEFQVTYLMGKVIRNIYDPASDASFQAGETTQLEQILQSFLPILDRTRIEFGRHCAALAICSSALFLLYGQGDQTHDAPRVANEPNRLEKMELVALRLVYYTERCYSSEHTVDYATLSPFLPVAIYQSAVVLERAVRLHESPTRRQAFAAAKLTLGYLRKRWASAGMSLWHLVRPDVD